MEGLGAGGRGVDDGVGIVVDFVEAELISK
jgi:hypothetical protein